MIIKAIAIAAFSVIILVLIGKIFQNSEAQMKPYQNPEPFTPQPSSTLWILIGVMCVGVVAILYAALQ